MNLEELIDNDKEAPLEHSEADIDRLTNDKANESHRVPVGDGGSSSSRCKTFSATQGQWKSDTCLEAMHRMRPHLCDVCLLTEDGHRVYAHRVVLASSLQYFSSMFLGPASSFNDAKPKQTTSQTGFVEQKQFEIHIQNITGQSLEEIVHYCYTGSVHITEDTVQALWLTAAMLNCSDIVTTCAEFIKSRLQVFNALGVFSFAELMSCQELRDHVLVFICDHFLKIASQDNEEFRQLLPENLIKIISSDYLDTQDEGEVSVFRAVLAWIEMDPAQRRKHLPELAKYIRFPIWQLPALLSIESDFPLTKEEGSIKDLLIEALKYRLCKVTSTSHPDYNTITLASTFSELNLHGLSSSLQKFMPNATQMFDLASSRFRERTPRSKQACLLVVGGQAPKAIRESEYFNFGSGQWCTFPFELPGRRCRCAMVVLASGHIYAIGGFNGQARVKTVDIFDPKLNEWFVGPSLEARRSTLGACVVDGLIYVVGGFDGHIGLQTAEMFDPSAKKWRYIAEMSTRRSSVAVTALKGRIYAVGGYDGATRQCLSSVESYDPTTNTWTRVADMSQRRSGAAVAVMNGKIYAIGGHDGPSIRKSVECYDPSSDSWSQCSDMITSRRNAGVVTKDSKLYVIGGDDGQSNLKSIEVYMPLTNSWSKLPGEMSVGRSYAGVAIINKSWS